MGDDLRAVGIDRRDWLSVCGLLASGASLTKSVGAVTTRQSPETPVWTSFQHDRSNSGYLPDTPSLVAGITDDRTHNRRHGIRVSPIASSETVYICGTVVNDSAGSLTALDRSSGRERWSSEMNTAVVSTPAVADGRLYAALSDRLAALDSETGDEQWSAPVLPAGFSSPTIHNDRVYIGTRSGALAAIDTTNGTVSWRAGTESSEPVNTTPAVGTDRVYVGSEDNALYAFTLSDGSESWRTAVDAPVRAGVALSDGRVYAATSAGTLLAVDAATGEISWRFSVDTSTVSSPAVTPGTVYWTAESTLYALSTTDGTEQWRFETRGFSGLNNVAPPPSRVGDVVCLTTGHDRVYGVDATDGTERWYFEPDSEASVLSATLVGDTAYVGTSAGTVHVLTGRTNLRPAASISYLPRNPSPGEEVTFEASESTDPDGSITKYEWDFDGDGTFDATGKRVTRTFSAGEHTVTLRITDDSGASNTTRLSSPLVVATSTPAAGTERSGQSNGPPALIDAVPGDLTGVGVGGGVLGLAVLAGLGRRLVGSGSSDPEDPQPESPENTAQTGDTSSDSVANERTSSARFVGTSYEEYEQQSTIGTGDMTAVVRANLRDSDESVALKTIEATGGTIDTDILDRFVDGVEAWSKIDDHEHVLTVHEWGDSPVPWAVLELADGQFDPREFADLPRETKRDLIVQLCEGVHHGHRYGLVHGSLEPSNVLYVGEDDPAIRIADWGVTREALTTVDHNQANDITRLSELTYELWTGKKTSANMTDIESNESLSYEFKSVLDRGLHTDEFETALHLRDAVVRTV